MKNPDRSWLIGWDQKYGLYWGWYVLPCGEKWLYVGGSCKPRAFRWNEHRTGINASRFVKRYGTTLARIKHPKWMDERWETRDEMVAMEAKAALWFKRQGYMVRQG